MRSGPYGPIFSVECTTYIESLCTQKCQSISKAVKEFNMQSTCPCQCTCSEFIPSRCETDCQKQNKITVSGSTDQHGCLNCQCTCPPFHNDTCHSHCQQEGKLQVQGAKSRYGCDICQCGCLNRDCQAECGDLGYRRKTGDHGCIIGCQCICPEDCQPNCLGCINKG